MATAVPKPIMNGTTLSVFPESAEGCVRYYLDLSGLQILLTPDVLNQALQFLPKIGDYKDFSGVVGAPRSTSATQRFNVAIHDMRVYNLRVMPTDNPYYHFIDVLYKSRPQPTIEYGSSGLQEQTNTYTATDPATLALSRKQMILNYTASKNDYSFPTDIPCPKAPLTGTVLKFGSTVRIASTFYSDELSQEQLKLLQAAFATKVNIDPLFYTNPSIGLGDALDRRLWLCSSLNGVSNDGGYSQRVSAEFVFNITGWDTIGTYQFNNAPAILSDQTVAALYTTLVSSLNVPDPFIGNGGGRFPQQVGAVMTPFLGFISQGVLATAVPINQIISS